MHLAGIRISDYDSAILQLLYAPLESGRWLSALTHTARATGSATAALVGATGSSELRFGLSALMTPAEVRTVYRDIAAHGFSDPVRNPMFALGSKAHLLQDYSCEEAFADVDRKRHPVWNEFYVKSGLPNLVCCPIWRSAEGQLVLQLSRSANQPTSAARERKIFRSLAVRWREAVLFSRAIKDEGARLLTGAFDHLSIAAFVFDGFGRVIAATNAAEQIATAGRLLRLRNGRIETTSAAEQTDLDQAVRRASGESCDEGIATTLRLHGLNNCVATARAWPLPRENDIGLGATAMLLIDALENPEPDNFGLTEAENEISRAMLAGRRIDRIARDRGVSIQTVRTQIKSIYSKTGVHSRVELMSRQKG